MRTALILAALAALPAFAQSSAPVASAPVAATASASAAPVFNHPGITLLSRYNKIRGWGNTSFIVPVVGDSSVGLTFVQTLYFDGEPDKSKPTGYALNFGSASSDWQFLELDSIACLIDGARKSYPAERSGDVGESGVVESGGAQIPAEDFAAIANAKKAECQIGAQSFEIVAAWKQAMLHMLNNTASHGE